MDGVFGGASEDVGQVGLRVDAVHLGGLCRPVNYAERSRAQSSVQSLVASCREDFVPTPFGIVWLFTVRPERRADGRWDESGLAFRLRRA